MQVNFNQLSNLTPPRNYSTNLKNNFGNNLNFTGTINITHKPNTWESWRDGNGVEFNNFDYRTDSYGVTLSRKRTSIDTDHIQAITDDGITMEDDSGNTVTMTGLLATTLHSVKEAYNRLRHKDSSVSETVENKRIFTSEEEKQIRLCQGDIGLQKAAFMSRARNGIYVNLDEEAQKTRNLIEEYGQEIYNEALQRFEKVEWERMRAATSRMFSW